MNKENVSILEKVKDISKELEFLANDIPNPRINWVRELVEELEHSLLEQIKQ